MGEHNYKNYLLVILLTVLAFNQVDRLALGLLLQDIKVDLKLSDTELGLLSGLAFAIFYSAMGIPIARWADRGNRVSIIAITTLLWSAAVALCGAAGNFMQLILARIGVAVGESGCLPPAHSLIASNFSRGERPKAVARYMLGAPLSMVIGYFLAGWLNQVYGWRVTFFFLGLPGPVMAALAWFTLREPRRNGEKRERLEVDARVKTHAHPTMTQVCANLLRNQTFRHLLLCFAVTSFFGQGISKWMPTFFIRSYGLHTGELGTWFALVYGLGGVIGTYAGGTWASRRAAGNERRQLRGIAATLCLCAVTYAAIYLSPNAYLAFAAVALSAVGVAAVAAPLFATIQTLVPESMRATSIALIYLFANLIGMGLGPLVAGALSDAFAPIFGQEALRYALVAMCPGYLWSAWHLFKASVSVADDLRRVHAESEHASTDAIPMQASR